LLDARIPRQSIRFAITGRGTDQAAAVPQWDPRNRPSTQNFDDLFTSARAPVIFEEEIRSDRKSMLTKSSIQQI